MLTANCGSYRSEDNAQPLKHVPRLTDHSEKKQQNHARRINGRDRGIDVLVYNAGSGVWGNIEEMSAHDFEQSWRINTMGAFLVSKQVIPSMKKKKTGSIIFIGATASLRGRPFTTAFAPAKASQRSLAQAMARHLWPSGIHVSLIIIDGGVNSLDSDANVEAPETLDPDDIATTAYFLSQQPRSAWSFEVDVRPSQESW